MPPKETAVAGSVGQPTFGAMPFVASKANTNWATRTNAATELAMGRLVTDSTAQNNAVSWDAYWTSVTYKYAQVYGKGTDQGIYTVQLDGVSQGTIDAYNGSATSNNYSEITGLSITTAGAKTFQLIMATKNVSSSAYGAALNSWLWCETSGTFPTPAGTDTPGYTWEHFPFMGNKMASAAVTNQQASTALAGSQHYLTAGAQNSYIENDVWLEARTYKFAYLYYRATDQGIATFSLDGSSFGTADQYGAAADNNYAEITGIAVTPAGVKAFRYTAATKNASSSGYYMVNHSVKWTSTGA